MILIGDKIVPYENIYKVSSIDEIQNSKSNSIVSFGYNEKLLTYCNQNSVFCAVVVDSLKDAIYSNALNARYIICNKNLAISVQKIADNYMFDSKVLAIIESSDEVEDIALNQIDGIIYKTLI